MEQDKHSRRAFFKRVALGGVGATLGAGFVQRISDLWVAKAEHGNTALDLHEMTTLAAMGAQIIPSDDTPGAREAGIVDYIDNKIKGIPASREAYQKGLKSLDDLSQEKFGSSFVSLQPAQQTDLLKSMEKSEFFRRVWSDTVEAFSRSRLGQNVMGYPGGSQPHGYHQIENAPLQNVSK